ncbi:MAG: hypothetical protein K8Q97_02150 [Candidatus Andersenbacteria bacterium]|nr:hypothetical protein [Candidatus Andersenbacteria bacterium]
MDTLIISSLNRFQQQVLCDRSTSVIAIVCPQCKEQGLHCMRFHDALTGDRSDGVACGWSAPCAFSEEFSRRFFHSCEDHGGVPIGKRFVDMEELLVFVELGS